MIKDITLRELCPEDKERALEIIRMCYPENLTVHNEFDDRFDAGQSPQKGAYVVRYIGAFEDNELIGIGGYAQSSMTDAYWEFSWGTVQPNKQGQGIGKKLIDYRIEQVLKRTTTPHTFVIISTKPTSLYIDSGFHIIAPTSDQNKSILCQQIA